MLSKKEHNFILAIPKIEYKALLYDSSSKLLKHKILQLLIELKQRLYLVEYPPIKYDDMPYLYNLSDIVVLPSRFMKETSSDRSPNVALESLACGCILIASYVGGIPDIADRCFIPVRPNDVIDLTKKIMSLLTGSSKYKNSYKKIVLRARKRAVKYLSLEVYARSILKSVLCSLRGERKR